MSFELKEGNGSLFKNTRKEKDTHPDYTGTIKINGEERYLSAWVKEGKNGKFFSLSLGKIKENRPRSEQTSYDKDFDDDIPFR